MLHRKNRLTNTGRSQKFWPVFALLTAVVVLPTAGVLWFMNQAMQTEQQAVRLRLTEIYRSQLQSTSGRIQTLWEEKLSVLDQAASQTSKPEAFAALVKAGHVDSVLFYENGRPAYPNTLDTPKTFPELDTPVWLEAQQLEFVKNDPKAAAAVYEKIMQQTSEARESAMAAVARARCLFKSQRRQDAIELLNRTFGNSRYRNVAGPENRMIAPNAFLFAIELMGEPSHPLFQKTADQLYEYINDYGEPAMPSSQRRFLMQQLQALWPECPDFPTRAAEELSAEFHRDTPDNFKPGYLQSTPNRDIWAYRNPDKSLVALFKTEQLLDLMKDAFAEQDPIPGVSFSVLSPDDADQVFIKSAVGSVFPSWYLALTLEGPDPFQSVTSNKKTLYTWTGILMTSGIVLLSILLAGSLRQQVRLTRLKNDLIATVSHELKTPLASMRLLVDTLRDGHYQDSRLVQEYLGMIAKENARLSSLIEGFLTFSRMERNKGNFERTVIRMDEIIQDALEAVGNRIQARGCRLELDLEPRIPPVVGDRDSLITVFVNLLDNALKYTGDRKEIRLRGFSSNGNVVIEVQDNGIGFPQGAAKKIFNRFYQADRSLSRDTGGCGLGLSIVQYIVRAHNGTVTASSQPGEGSTFTVQLPAAEDATHAE